MNSRNDFGLTSLHRAVWFNQSKNVRALFISGADVNSADNNGDTPLILAARRGFDGISAQLLRYNCKKNTQNNSGETALHTAARHGHLRCVELLMEAGCDLEIKNIWGRSAFEVAQQSGKNGCASTLKENGAKKFKRVDIP